MECNLRSFLNVTNPTGHFVPFQQHKYHELVYYKSGKGKTTVNGEVFEYCDKSVIVIPHNVIHDEVTSEPTEVLFCLFECDEQTEIAAGQLYQCDDVLVSQIENSFARIKEEYVRKAAYSQELLNHIMTQIFITVLRAGDTVKKNNDVASYIKTYIKEYCTQKISFEMLSENLGYSSSRMRHVFKEKYGQSMQTYQINSRINIAKNMLENTDLSINEVGFNCGFKSTSKFIEKFKELCGLTPKKYRNIMRISHDETFTIQT